MSQKENLENHSSVKWDVESLRLTVFCTAGMTSKNNWWKEITGNEAEKNTILPAKSTSQEEGAFENGKLVVRTAPGRIDVVYTVSTDSVSTPQEFMSLGPFDTILQRFQKISQAFLKSKTLPEVNRLAFGAILVFRVNNLEEGYHRLGPFLPNLEIDPKRSFDFLYQINKPRQAVTTIPGLSINRLSKWSVMKVIFIKALVEGDKGSASTVENYACRLELDINTFSDFKGPLPKSELLRLFQEFTDLAVEISNNGDQP